MGITGELVRSVFSRNRSFGTPRDTNLARSNVTDKKRWGSVRSYLCGDEFSSVVAEEDSSSVKSSEATVTQPIPEGSMDLPENQSDETEPNIPDGNHNPISKLFHEEDAAMVIQSAFRNFLARRLYMEIKRGGDKQEPPASTESPSRESISTSIEVQTGNSVEVFSVQDESKGVHHRVQQKPKALVLRIKEDWDDSTVSSNISKMRIQNKLEAMTRRERALAYAFSQQLRICSKRKQAKPDGMEQNMSLSWNWLERWMATRVPDSSLGETNTKKPFEPVDNNNKLAIRKGIIDAAGDEKESCGSNEVSVQPEALPAPTCKEKDQSRRPKNRLKATRSISRRKTVPSYQPSKESGKVNKKEGSRESVKYKMAQEQAIMRPERNQCNDD
ncbi:protein IQ-DOMAIN 1-like isoform X3 [Hibiscus syriacus]|uniref:Protein IQ-DOMAIN 1-like isoform X3 n=1 Tax=Hibiscus syriacus TaxID=106335 RepID=A0A6A2X1Q2_HIBSY|nr:protein IQ-DOMAIN 1 [Hibiscus syriacus]KAE8668713.1 protein IQ-DOMAIN 1-like isoform X3 [Hibiscus syriacus]